VNLEVCYIEVHAEGGECENMSWIVRGYTDTAAKIQGYCNYYKSYHNTMGATNKKYLLIAENQRILYRKYG
jgi:hypothetical protein